MGKVSNPSIKIVQSLSTTEKQGSEGTEIIDKIKLTNSSITNLPVKIDTPVVTPDNSDDDSIINNNTDTIPYISNMDAEISPPFQVILSDDPIDNAFDTKVDIKDAHITLGL